MIFESFIKSGKVIKGEKDFDKSKALIKMSDNSLMTASKIQINETSAAIVLTVTYESMRELLEAMCLREGYKVYSHEAYTAFLKNINDHELAEKFDRFRKLRNGVNYYGDSVSETLAKSTINEITELNKKIKEKYLKC